MPNLRALIFHASAKDSAGLSYRHFVRQQGSGRFKSNFAVGVLQVSAQRNQAAWRCWANLAGQLGRLNTNIGTTVIKCRTEKLKCVALIPGEEGDSHKHFLAHG